MNSQAPLSKHPLFLALQRYGKTAPAQTIVRFLGGVPGGLILVGFSLVVLMYGLKLGSP